MSYTLPPLPYADNALDPVISANTLSFHYGKHHQGYCTKYNAAIENTPMADMPLEDVIKQTASDASKKGIFNNAAQIYNHTFYWHSMRKSGGGTPSGKVSDLIKDTWGDFDTFKKEFTDKAGTLFGSGWTWLIKDGSKLAIVQTKDAETPITQGKTPLITIDVWEHAYYLDYQNRRPDYINAFMDKLVNWDFANQNLG
ncbi:MAG: superoxide dismutase [Bdellovibrionales bacterium]|nr:superoxide dismutase [Bdellovibrionales bacterium]